jgi:pimeloyl-[acyl-carrier protein] methyl ester esterase
MGTEREGLGLHCAATKLAIYLHLVDLPGYGRSSGFSAMTLQEMAQQVLAQAPQRAIWLGWSLGGLVASKDCASLSVSALVTVHHPLF